MRHVALLSGSLHGGFVMRLVFAAVVAILPVAMNRPPHRPPVEWSMRSSLPMLACAQVVRPQRLHMATGGPVNAVMIIGRCLFRSRGSPPVSLASVAVAVLQVSLV